jgi:protein ImuB
MQLDDYLHQHQLNTQQDHIAIYDETHNQLVQLSDAAAAVGLTTNMGLATASALTSQLQIVPFNGKKQALYLDHIATVLYQVAADIVQCPPQGIAIKLDPLIRYYNGLRPLIKMCLFQANKTRFSYHYGTGWSIESACILAKTQQNKIYSTTNEIQQALYAQPIELTDINAKNLSKLKRSGIKNLAQLLTIPLDSLARRLDNEVIYYLRGLHGEQYTKAVFFRPQPTISIKHELAFEVVNISHLTPYLTQALEQFEKEASLRNLTSQELQLTLIFREHTPLTITVKSALPQYKVDFWLPLFTLHFEKLRLPGPIIEFDIQCLRPCELEHKVEDMFSTQHDPFTEAQLIGQLLAKLGETRVIEPQLPQEHRYLPYTTNTSPLNNTGINKLPSTINPALLLAEPELLCQECQILYGPERIETGWWDNHPHQRDYFVAQTQQGQYLWVFRDQHNTWFIQGWCS